MGTPLEERAYLARAAILALALLAGCSRGEEEAPAKVGASAMQAPAAPVELPGELPASQDPLLAQKYARKDASADPGWESEVFNGLAGKQLSALGHLIEGAGELGEAQLDALASEGFAGSALRPKELGNVLEGAVRVSRQADGEATPDRTGRADLLEALRELRAPFAGAREVHVHFKIVSVELEDSSATTTALYAASGDPPSGRVEQHATWRCRWTRPAAPEEPPRLERVEVSHFEECAGPPGGEALFADVTGAVLGGERSFQEQLRFPLEHWAARLDIALGTSLIGHEGIAVGDANGDGLDDLYVCQGGGLPNRLYLQNLDGTARDASAEAGVDFLDPSHGALFVDLDGDGDQDLAVELSPAVVILENDGKGRFSARARLDAPSTTMLCAADYDLDGDLDLYLCGYMLPDERERTPVPYHDANNGRPNVLLRNDGKWRFADVTREVGLDVNNRRYSFAAAWEDYDDDGDPDLYVSNDFGRNNLYRNDGGRFADVAAEAGVEDMAAGMGVTWADYDRDGRLDLYVSNMFSSAGERVTYQRRFMPGSDGDLISSYQRHARGNSLFHNAGDGGFRDVSEEAGVTVGRWAWGALFADFDSDGWPDLAVPNGFVTGSDPDDL
jgi:hypothetical protein